MGVALAIGVGGAAMAGGIMSAIGGQKNAEAQYLSSVVQTERNNFEKSLANDKKNVAAARANALRRWNNKDIEKAAIKNFADVSKFNRDAFKAELKNTAKQQFSYQASLTAKATGKNLRGGMADRMQSLAKENFQQERKNIFKRKYQADTSAKAQYKNSLNQRDMLSYQSANVFIPGTTGVEPGSGALGMVAAILGGAASGISAGAGVYGNVQK